MSYPLFYKKDSTYTAIPYLYNTANATVTPSSSPTPPPPPTGSTRDKFGIKMLFPSVTGGREFFPPDNISTNRVTAVNRIGATEMVVHGQGAITPSSSYYKIEGSAPRMYIYDAARQKKWDNVEITCYYNKASTSSTSYAGFVMGGRSIHETGGTNAKVYYLKHHFTSKKFYFMKEHEHGGSGNRGYVDNGSSSPTSSLDQNTWYGAKFVIRTKGSSVVLQAYKDETGGRDGGDWKKLNELTDSGGWNGFAPYMSGSSCMFRTDGVTDFRIKWFSVRTIAPI